MMRICLTLALMLTLAAAACGQNLSLDSTGLLTWTNGGNLTGYYRVEYFIGNGLNNGAWWWSPTNIANAATRTQSAGIPWAYRLAWTEAATASDGTNVIPLDWSPMSISTDGRNITWWNVDDSTPYALGWKYTLTDSVWQANWSPFLNLDPSASGSIRMPIHFALFMRRVYIETPADMVRIIEPSFVMGDTIGDGKRDELPLRTITNSVYLIDTTEVTEYLWETVRLWASSNGYTDLPAGTSMGSNYPVRGVSWVDAAKWCNARSEMLLEIPEYRDAAGAIVRSGLFGIYRTPVNGFHLPTEAEWEHAARGSGGKYGCGTDVVTIWPYTYSTSASAFVYTTSSLACYREMPRTSRAPVMPVASMGASAWSMTINTNMVPDSKKSGMGWSDANSYGLRDMAGNVWELCNDWFGGYDPAQTLNPSGPTSGLRRVIRGGGWNSKASDLRVSARNSVRPTIRNRGVGFRCAKRVWANENGNNLLVVYNTNDASSASLASYYVATRPGISGATMLGIGCSTGEVTTWGDFITNFYNPVITALDTNPALRYVVCMYGVPTRTTNGLYSPAYYIAENFDIDPSLSYNAAKTKYLPAGYPRTRALVTYLTARTPAAVTSYIDRLAAKYDGHGRLSGNVTNAWYVFDDGGGFATPGLSASGAVRLASSTAQIQYEGVTNVTAATNVTGYLGWGWNGSLGGGFATNGAVVFSGSSWYILATIESFNGQLQSFQSDYGDWFSVTAFGSTNYEHCPIGAIAYTMEPTINGINNETYFQLWESGLCFAECAWSSLTSGGMIAIGDPLVTK